MIALTITRDCIMHLVHLLHFTGIRLILVHEIMSSESHKVKAGSTAFVIAPSPHILPLPMGSPERGHVERIWLKRVHRGLMDPVQKASLTIENGIERSVGWSRRRQVTLIDLAHWNSICQSLDATINPIVRRANVLLSGIALAHTRKRVLRIGAARLTIGGETTPCERMDEAYPGLQQAMRADWGGGVFAHVLFPGDIHVGDDVEWVTDDAQLNLSPW